MIKTSSSRSHDSDGGSSIGTSAALIPIAGSGAPRRTLDDIREQVAQEVAVRAITSAKTVDGIEFLLILATKL